MYGTDATFSTQFRRLFGNVELRPTQSVLLNVGGMIENSSLSGSTFAPRMMVNWHFLPDQTVRFGSSRAYRPPSTYEDKVDTAYVGTKQFWLPVLPAPYNFVTSPTLLRPVVTTYVSPGNLRPESLVSSEVGYLGDFRKLGLTVDIRAFYESLGEYIGHGPPVTVPATAPMVPGLTSAAKTYANLAGFPIRGVEGQLNFRPSPNTRVIINHASIRIDSPEPSIATAAPRETDGLTLFQKLPGGIDLSVMHQQASSAPWVTSQSKSHTGNVWRRLDLRIAKPFQVGATKGEVACVVQNIGPAYNDYPTGLNAAGVTNPGYPGQQFERRAFLTFSLEM
jgi:iron complex outermembrane receptor protein